MTGLVTSHLVDGLQNAAFQAAYLQGRGWLFYLLHEFERIIDILQQTQVGDPIRQNNYIGHFLV